MNSQADFEGQIREFSGLEHAHNFSSFEMWTHNITQLWNLLSPYNHTMQVPCRHYVHILHQHLQARIMAKTDKIVGCELKDGLNISSEWAATPYIPTFMSLLINFARAQLSALAEEDEINQKKYNKRPATAAFTEHADKRQRFANWGAQVAASVNGGPATTNGSSPSCSFCGRHHSLDQCRGVQNLIAQHQQKQLDRAGPTMAFGMLFGCPCANAEV
jgi:hypothetical protein